MKKNVKILYIILCVLFVGVFIFAGYKLLEGELGYYFARKAYDNLSSSVVSANTSTPSPKEEVEEDEIVLDPEVSPIDVNFDEISKECSDIAAWLYSPTINVINYPVVQFDDNSFYLNHRYDGQYSACGTLFLDCLNMPEFENDNTVIYGHHMNDGSMFAQLVKYSSQEYYDEHPVFYMNTPKYNYRLEVISGYITNDNDETTYKFEFKDDAEAQSFIDYIISKSKFESNFEVSTSDKFCTLSTCTYEYDNARFVVHCKMVAIH